MRNDEFKVGDVVWVNKFNRHITEKGVITEVDIDNLFEICEVQYDDGEFCKSYKEIVDVDFVYYSEKSALEDMSKFLKSEISKLEQKILDLSEFKISIDNSIQNLI